MKQASDNVWPPQAERLSLRNLTPHRATPSCAADVQAGLASPQKYLPCKYFYDDRGSQLFEQICTTPEYYPWRMEHALLLQYAQDIVEQVAPDHLIEFGSGASTKTRRLLDACAVAGRLAVYTPIDVCAAAVRASAETLSAHYPWLQIDALVGDYLGGLGDLGPRTGRALFVFLGGTIGNFDDKELTQFTSDLRAAMQPTDRLLLGIDLIKEPRCLDAAYNDTQGYTRAFNLNMLRVLNTRLSGQFRLSAFRHRAFYEPLQERIEMHLVSEERQTVGIGALHRTFEFARHESIRTEISRKFNLDTLDARFAALGFGIAQRWISAEPRFCLLLLAPQGSALSVG